MKYLVDTNVLSEAAKARPNPVVKEWLEKNRSSSYVATITVGEIRYGIEKLSDEVRKEQLQKWLHKTLNALGGRVLGFPISVAHTWGQMRAKLAKEGMSLPLADGQIAAVAKHHGLTVVTRNVKDFRLAGIRTLNPFEES